MSSPTFPAELLHKVADWIFDFGDMETLKALTLTAQCLVTHVQTLLFHRIAFGASGVRRPGEFLKILEARPNLAHFVKSVTLKQSALQLKASIAALHRMHNVERVVILGEEFWISNIQSVSSRAWSWARLSPSMAASLTRLGQHLPQLKELVFRDIEELPISSFLDNAPQVDFLDFARTKCPAVTVNPIHNLTSLRWNLDDNSWSTVNPVPLWLLASSLTHLHLITKPRPYSHFETRPNCGNLVSLKSLKLEVYREGNCPLNVPGHTLQFLLDPLETLPKEAPLEIFTVTLKDLRSKTYNGWNTRGNWAKLDSVVLKLGAVLVKRIAPLKKVRVEMFGFTGHGESVRNALKVVDVATVVEVEVNENGFA
ncbi:hypothetical protein DL96DRAFT_556713 [Flagelloscypha sp. PMI_526]|nr:hypothetical protein DL96DRAFT_556713 [Flagelloscypha sp. PMI_526]